MGIQMFGQMSFCVFWDEIKSVDWEKQITLPNAAGPHPVSQTAE